MSGVTGGVEDFYIHPITVRVGRQSHNIMAGFLLNFSDNGYAIVGQKGFFDNFVVKFDLMKEELELKERK